MSQGFWSLARPLDCDWLVRRRKGGNKLQRQRKSLGVTIREGRAQLAAPRLTSLYSLVFTCPGARERRRRRARLTLSPQRPPPTAVGAGPRGGAM